ncbi:hypothetical protein N9L68_05930 [bacterium]|nr:hypothetical protein [bacterium]
MAAAKTAGKPPACIEMLEEQLETKKRASFDSRPLGTRIASAMSRAEKARTAVSKAAEHLARAREKLGKAIAEKEDADASLAKITAKAAEAGCARHPL